LYDFDRVASAATMPLTSNKAHNVAGPDHNGKDATAGK
jgi:hypothetical protein